MEDFLAQSISNDSGTPVEGTQPADSQIPDALGDAQITPAVVDITPSADEGKPEVTEPQEELIPISRYKNLQAAFTKATQERAALRAEVNTLKKSIQPKLELSEEQKYELEVLKASDPDTWRQRLNEMENKYYQQIDAETAKYVEIERRRQLLAEHNSKNKGFELSDAVVQTMIPAGIFKELQDGKVSFEQFLENANNFLRAHKIGRVGDGSTANAGVQSPINAVGGGSTGVTPQQEKEQEWFL